MPLLMKKEQNISHLNKANASNEPSAQPSNEKKGSGKFIGVLLVVISAVSWGFSGSIAQ